MNFAKLFDEETGDKITQLYGCECDLDAPCNVPQCLMERDLEMRRMSVWYTRKLREGWNPDQTYRENVERIFELRRR